MGPNKEFCVLYFFLVLMGNLYIDTAWIKKEKFTQISFKNKVKAFFNWLKCRSGSIASYISHSHYIHETTAKGYKQNIVFPVHTESGLQRHAVFVTHLNKTITKFFKST